MMKILDPLIVMKMKMKLNPLPTFNMKNIFKMFEINKGCHQEEGGRQDVIQVLGILEGLLIELEVEVFNHVVLLKLNLFLCL